MKEDWYDRQERLGLIAVSILFLGGVATILISNFLDISITFK
ncbi:hypothetical protein [Paraclostridium dentum]